MCEYDLNTNDYGLFRFFFAPSKDGKIENVIFITNLYSSVLHGVKN